MTCESRGRGIGGEVNLADCDLANRRSGTGGGVGFTPEGSAVERGI